MSLYLKLLTFALTSALAVLHFAAVVSRDIYHKYFLLIVWD